MKKTTIFNIVSVVLFISIILAFKYIGQKKDEARSAKNIKIIEHVIQQNFPEYIIQSTEEFHYHDIGIDSLKLKNIQRKFELKYPEFKYHGTFTEGLTRYMVFGVDDDMESLIVVVREFVDFDTVVIGTLIITKIK